MPIDPKDALAYLGINADEMADIDAFKAHVSTTYVPRAEAHKDPDIMRAIVGRDKGVLRTKLKGAGKELGLEDVKWDDVDPTEGIDLLTARAKARTAELSSQLEEAKKGGKGAGKDVEELTTKYAEAKKLADELKGQLGTWETKYNELETSVSQREKQARVNAQWERAIGGIKPNADVTPLALKGFQAAVREKFAIEFDDEGSPYAVDAQSKKRIPNPNKAHDFLGLDDLVKKYAEEEKLIGGNPKGGTAVKGTSTLLGTPARQPDAAPQGTPARRQIMPRV
jgi:hypothetical protein